MTKQWATMLITAAALAGCGDFTEPPLREFAQDPQPALIPNGGWTITDLGAIDGSQSFAAAINNTGVSAGTSSTPAGLRGATFQGGSINPIGTLGGTWSGVRGINDAGQLVGYSAAANGKVQPFLYDAGAISNLGVLPGGSEGSATDINNAGQIVGYSDVAVGTRGILWQAGSMISLGVLAGGGYSAASAINDNGDIAGWSDGLDHTTRAALWRNGSWQNLGVLPGGYSSQAMGLNDLRRVVGFSYGPDGTHAFLWKRGVMTNLGTLPGGIASEAYGINNAEQIVGYSADSAGSDRAVVWFRGTITDLGTLPGGNFARAAAINENGSIVGLSDSPLGTRAVLWTPVNAGRPAAPSGLTATSPSRGQVELMWTDNSGNETRYNLSRRERDGDVWTAFAPVATLPFDAMSYADTDLPPGSEYQYRLQACNFAGCSANATSNAIRPEILPLAPSQPNVLVINATQVEVFWGDNSDNETHFELARRALGGNGIWGGYATIATPPANEVNRIDNGVTAGQYQYRIRACNSVGCSAWVIGVRISTVAPPAAPTELTATKAGTVLVSWVVAGDSHEVFHLKRRLRGPDGIWSGWVQVAAPGRDDRSYSDGTATGEQAQYGIRACNPGGCSTWTFSAALVL